MHTSQVTPCSSEVFLESGVRLTRLLADASRAVTPRYPQQMPGLKPRSVVTSETPGFTRRTVAVTVYCTELFDLQTEVLG